ncbi:hypothetical protein, partial [Stenotrophomonas forensis]
SCLALLDSMHAVEQGSTLQKRKSTRSCGVPSKLGTCGKCRLQGRHFRSGCAGTAVTLRVTA